MSFANQILGGQNKLIRPAIQSPNYAAGSAGWQISKSGSAEFNDATVRGTLDLASGESIDFEGTHTSAGGTDAKVYGLAAASASSPSFLIFASPTDDTYTAVLELAGESEDNTAPPYAHLFQGDPSAAGGIPLWLSALGYVPGSPGAGDLMLCSLSSWLYTTGAGFLGAYRPVDPAAAGTPSTMQDVTLDSGWQEYGAPYAPLRYVLLRDDMLFIDGLVKYTSSATGTVAVNSGTPLPAGYVPKYQAYSPAAGGGRVAWQITPAGVIEAAGVTGSGALLEIHQAIALS